MQTNRMVRMALFGLLGMWANHVWASFVLYQDRGVWEQAVGGIFYDVNLNDGTYNKFGGTAKYFANAPIYLPPDNIYTMSLDRDADVAINQKFYDYFASYPNAPGGFALQFAGGTITGTMAKGVSKFGFEFRPTDVMGEGLIQIMAFDNNKSILGSTLFDPVQVDQLAFAQFIGWVSDVPVTSFSISSKNGVYVGNFVVPDAGMTIGLLGCSLLGLSALRRWIS